MPSLMQTFLKIVLGKRKLAELQNLYIGLRHRFRPSIYHRWDCEFGGKIGFRGVLFNSQMDAAKAGYRPCKVCKPDRNPYSFGGD